MRLAEVVQEVYLYNAGEGGGNTGGRWDDSGRKHQPWNVFSRCHFPSISSPEETTHHFLINLSTIAPVLRPPSLPRCRRPDSPRRSRPPVVWRPSSAESVNADTVIGGIFHLLLNTKYGRQVLFPPVSTFITLCSVGAAAVWWSVCFHTTLKVIKLHTCCGDYSTSYVLRNTFCRFTVTPHRKCKVLRVFQYVSVFTSESVFEINDCTRTLQQMAGGAGNWAADWCTTATAITTSLWLTSRCYEHIKTHIPTSDWCVFLPLLLVSCPRAFKCEMNFLFLVKPRPSVAFTKALINPIFLLLLLIAGVYRQGRLPFYDSVREFVSFKAENKNTCSRLILLFLHSHWCWMGLFDFKLNVFVGLNTQNSHTTQNHIPLKILLIKLNPLNKLGCIGDTKRLDGTSAKALLPWLCPLLSVLCMLCKYVVFLVHNGHLLSAAGQCLSHRGCVFYISSTTFTLQL